jgi:hypothetical protein
MDEKITDQKRDIPAFNTARKQVDVSGMGLSEQFALSFDDFRTAIKQELAALESRIAKLEGTRE